MTVNCTQQQELD